jgi:hypothetical protein
MPPEGACTSHLWSTHRDIPKKACFAASSPNNWKAKQLTGIIELTHEVLDDPQQTYILAVDKLDEDWGLRIASRGPLTAPEFGLANPSSKFRNARS